jgi:hypothetical protein
LNIPRSTPKHYNENNADVGRLHGTLTPLSDGEVNYLSVSSLKIYGQYFKSQFSFCEKVDGRYMETLLPPFAGQHERALCMDLMSLHLLVA